MVYEAVDARSFRRVALKGLRGASTDPTPARRALEHEAAAMEAARGSRICRCYGVEECYGQPWLVLEGVSDHYVAIDFADEVRRFRP